MEKKVYLEIGKKVHENNRNWKITKIEECGWNEMKKKWFVRLRDEHTVKKDKKKVEKVEKSWKK